GNVQKLGSEISTSTMSDCSFLLHNARRQNGGRKSVVPFAIAVTLWPEYKRSLTIVNSHFRQMKTARKPQTNPRKLASQERSRSTVDALLEATARILVKEGYDRASTNRIAELAGVSIGSLYQYFPSKEALVAAVIDRHTQEVSEVTRKALLRA